MSDVIRKHRKGEVMGKETGRCLQVGELRKRLRHFSDDLLIRFRDGEASYPGIYLLRKDRTDHIDLGSPYPVRDRLAEVDRKCRKVDGRRPPPKPKVWVLIRRYEWEDQSQQTENCDTFVFGSRTAAMRKASSLLRFDMKWYGDGVSSEPKWEEKAMLADFRSKFPRHLVKLTDGNNVVYELYKRSVQ